VDWLRDPTEGSIRAAVASAAPALAALEIVPAADLSVSDPEWCAGTALVARSLVVKVAWSERAAIRVLREARVLARDPRHADDVPEEQWNKYVFEAGLCGQVHAG
jgi:hypothetical protein